MTADEKIAQETRSYLAAHPGTSEVGAQAAVLKANPRLYTESIRAQNLRASMPATPYVERASRFREDNLAARELEEGEALIEAAAVQLCERRGLTPNRVNIATMTVELLEANPSLYSESIQQQAAAIRGNA